MKGSVWLETAKAMVRTIASKAPVAVAMALRALRAAELPLPQGLNQEAALFGQCCATEDFGDTRLTWTGSNFYDPATITRDAVFRGTALSAPVPNMLIQAAMTAVVVRWPSRRAAQALGGWGALMVAGYLGERLVRQRLRPSGWDALESPLLVAAIGLAVAMAVLGRRG